MNQNSTQKKTHSFKSTHEEKERLRNMSQVSNSKLKHEEYTETNRKEEEQSKNYKKNYYRIHKAKVAYLKKKKSH